MFCTDSFLKVEYLPKNLYFRNMDKQVLVCFVISIVGGIVRGQDHLKKLLGSNSFECYSYCGKYKKNQITAIINHKRLQLSSFTGCFCQRN